MPSHQKLLTTYLLAASGEISEHYFGVWELVIVPSEVFLIVCMFNVQPNNIVWHVMLVKALLNGEHVDGLNSGKIRTISTSCTSWDVR